MTNKIEVKDKQLFNKIAENYIKKDITLYCRMCRKLRLYRTLKNISKPIATLLEVGCGAGFSADYLKGQYNKFVGLDYSENLIAYAKNYNSSYKASFICKNIRDFKSKQKFEVILIIGVLHHIPELGKVLMDIKFHLKQGGVIVANEPQKGNPIIGLIRRIRKKIDSKYSTDQAEFLEAELRSIFIKCGYNVKTFSQGVLSTPLAETLILPGFIGVPLALFFKVLDPILETLISGSLLSKLAWNVVVEARIADDT